MNMRCTQIKGAMRAVRRLCITLTMSIVMLMISVSGQLRAQPSGLDDDPGSSVPLDGGASLLLGAGVAYGITRARKKRRMAGKRVKGLPIS